MSKEKLLPKLTDVESTIEKMNYSIKDICIEYYNKGYNDADSKLKCNRCGSKNHVHFRESMEYVCDGCIRK